MWKFLDLSGCTTSYGEFAYNLPRRAEKWARTDHPEPVYPDGEACGHGRLHLMKDLDNRYSPYSWWVWWARGIDLVGEDSEKAAYRAVELRRVSHRLFARCMRPPFNWGRNARLKRAILRNSDLRQADFTCASLIDADFRLARLDNAVFRRAFLRQANFQNTTLINADFTHACMPGANLRGAIVRGAKFDGAYMTEDVLFNTELSQEQRSQIVIEEDIPF